MGKENPVELSISVDERKFEILKKVGIALVMFDEGRVKSASLWLRAAADAADRMVDHDKGLRV